MIRVISGSLAVAVLGAVTVVGAQSSAQPVQQLTRKPATTVSGCLKAGSTPGTFVLEEGTVVKQESNAAVQPASRPTGTAGTAKGTYRLVGIVPPGVDLSKLLNHKVEVVGPVTEPAPNETRPPNINMHTFKDVASTCR